MHRFDCRESHYGQRDHQYGWMAARGLSYTRHPAARDLFRALRRPQHPLRPQSTLTDLLTELDSGELEQFASALERDAHPTPTDTYMSELHPLYALIDDDEADESEDTAGLDAVLADEARLKANVADIHRATNHPAPGEANP